MRRLRAEGFTVYVADAHSALGNWDWRLAIGGAKVRVPGSEFMRARERVRALDRGEYALTTEEGGGPAGHADCESWSSRLAYVFGSGFACRCRGDGTTTRGDDLRVRQRVRAAAA